MKKIKKIWDIVTTVIIAIVLVPVLLLVGTRLFGLQGYTVLSGSMEPVYKTGAVIFVAQTESENLSQGDVITFHLDSGMVATHRIVEVVQEDGITRYRTKGDANETADGSLVAADDVIGEPVFSVPYLGYVLTYIQKPPGRYVAIAVGAGILLLSILPGLLFPDDKKKKHEPEKQENAAEG